MKTKYFETKTKSWLSKENCLYIVQKKYNINNIILESNYYSILN